MDLQADAWQAAAQLRQTLTEQVFRWVAYAVMQCGLGRTFGLPLKRFQPGQEGCYANPGGNPVLVGQLCRWQREGTVGALDLHGLAYLQGVLQVSGVVTQGLDGNAHTGISRISSTEGEGVCALGATEVNESELPGLVPPVALQLAGDLQHIISQGAHGDDLPGMAS